MRLCNNDRQESRMSAFRYSFQPAAPAIALSTEQLVCKVRNQIFAMLDSLQTPIRVTVAGRSSFENSSFMNLLTVALHNLSTAPLHQQAETDRAVRLRAVRLHPSLCVIETIGLDYKTENQSLLLLKIISGAEDRIPPPCDIEAMGKMSHDQMVQMVSDSLVEIRENAIDEIVWVVNPNSISDKQAELLATLGPPSVNGLAQMCKYMIFTHNNNNNNTCDVTEYELHETARACWHDEEMRMFFVSGYDKTDDETPLVRSPERELRALQFLIDLLLRQQPMLTRFIC